MSEVKQTIPGVELTTPRSCLVCWAPEGPCKNYEYYTLYSLFYHHFLTFGLYFYIQTYWV